MKRPKTHFVSSNPQSGWIRQLYEGLIPHRSKIVVDNLAKFVLDSLNGLLYVDDRQIIIYIMSCDETFIFGWRFNGLDADTHLNYS